jgi:hypothetical protein
VIFPYGLNIITSNMSKFSEGRLKSISRVIPIQKHASFVAGDSNLPPFRVWPKGSLYFPEHQYFRRSGQ